MKKLFVVLSVVMVAVVVAGCTCPFAKCGGRKDCAGMKSCVALCGSCGQMKGSELCCKPDQVECGGCGLVKGSPDCCKIDI